MADFDSIIFPADLGYDPSKVNHSSPSDPESLCNALDFLKITPLDSILDIGCGKGKAMKTCTEYPFFKVDGIELMKEAAECAIANFSELKLDCMVTVCDACNFMDYGKYNFFMMYNPFPKVIFEKFIPIFLSQIHNPVTIIYGVPSNGNLLESSGFKIIKTFPIQNTKNIINIYRN